jgi:hypothetical protein
LGKSSLASLTGLLALHATAPRANVRSVLISARASSRCCPDSDEHAAELGLAHLTLSVVDPDHTIMGDLFADTAVVDVHRLEAAAEIRVVAGRAALAGCRRCRTARSHTNMRLDSVDTILVGSPFHYVRVRAHADGH